MAGATEQAGIAVSQEVILRKTALIRRLYVHACEQARWTRPLNSIAIVSLHDAVEWLVDLVLAAHGIKRKGARGGFLGHWELAKRKGIELGHERLARDLNDERIRVKHNARYAADEDILELCYASHQLLKDVSSRLLETEFDSASLATLISPLAARRLVLEAEGLASAGKSKRALELIARAMDILLRSASLRLTKRLGGRDPFDRIDVLAAGSLSQGLGVSMAVQTFSSSLHRAFTEIGSELRVLALGLDYANYARFRAVAPTVVLVYDGKGSQNVYWPEGARAPTEQDFGFCHRFLVESALTLEERWGADPEDEGSNP